MSSSKKARQSNSNNFAAVNPKNYAQGAYLESIRRNQITFGIGPAGTGKTYIATSYAAEQLFYRKIDKIILTRPAVQSGEGLGFLPGELQDKYAPYLAPFRDILDEQLGKAFVDYCIKVGSIEPVPIEFMRGRTFRNAICLIDEAQNALPIQMKLILTRIGENCKMIIDGDITQQDINGLSGLEDAVNRLSHIQGVETVRFLTADVVRSGICRKVLEAYEE